MHQAATVLQHRFAVLLGAVPLVLGEAVHRMLAIEFVKPGTVEPDPAFAAQVLEKCKEGGLLVGKGGLYGNVIRMGPPLTLTEAEAKEGLEILTWAMQ